MSCHWGVYRDVHPHCMSHTTPVPINWSLRFWVPAVHIFMFSMQHDFVPISYSARITILCQFRHDFVSISCSARITISHEIVNYSLHFRVKPSITFSSLPRLAQIPTSLSNGKPSFRFQVSLTTI